MVNVSLGVLLTYSFDVLDTHSTVTRFFQQSVLATDIADKDLKMLRDARWENAFSEGNPEVDQYLLNRKATVMIDCLLQASDIAHTMQRKCLLHCASMLHCCQ